MTSKCRVSAGQSRDTDAVSSVVSTPGAVVPMMQVRSPTSCGCSFSWPCIFNWENWQVTERCGRPCAMALTGGLDSLEKTGWQGQKDLRDCDVPSRLKPCTSWDPWIGAFWGFRSKEPVFILSCLRDTLWCNKKVWRLFRNSLLSPLSLQKTYS